MMATLLMRLLDMFGIGEYGREEDCEVNAVLN